MRAGKHAPESTELPRIGWSTREVAAAFGCSEKHIKNLIQRGDLPSVKLGDLRYVRDEDLRRVLAERTEHGWEPKRRDAAA